MGMPFDSSFLVTTVNKKDFAKAGITTMPTTLAAFTADLKKVGKANGMASPLDIQFATAEGLSTCWYQMTAAFGGQVLTAQDTPAFTSPSSPGYKAMTWMVNAYKSGLVPKGNINTTDYQGFTTEMAKNRVAAALCDYSGSVALHLQRAVIVQRGEPDRVHPDPGGHRSGPERRQPRWHRHPEDGQERGRRGEVHQVVHQTPRTRRTWAGLQGPQERGQHVPAAGQAVQLQPDWSATATAARASQLGAILKAHAQPPFPNGAPPWYVQFSAAVQTNIHQAAAGQETVAQAVSAIADQVNHAEVIRIGRCARREHDAHGTHGSADPPTR